MRHGSLEMHLDAPSGLIEKGTMPKTREIEVRAQLAIDATKHVEVERGGDAHPVVVRGVEDRRILPTVDAEEERAARADRAADSAEKCRGLGRVKVSDRRTGE